jgi:hypothetical protein
MDRATLRKLLNTHFDLEEIETLCFDLHIDFENLDGQSKQAKVRELVLYCERYRRIDELVATIRRLRPPLIAPPPIALSKRDPRIVVRPVNLDFGIYENAYWPANWFNSVGFVDDVSADYQAVVIARDDQPGSCVMFHHLRATDTAFGSLMQCCLAEQWAGQALRLQAEIKTSQVKGWAGMWLRADGKEKPGLVFDNMSLRPLQGTTPWRKYTIDVQLPSETDLFNYGIVLAGPGTMWAANFRVMVWLGRTWQDV